jgi:simple sugar transport system substrate-binding protein
MTEELESGGAPETGITRRQVVAGGGFVALGGAAAVALAACGDDDNGEEAGRTDGGGGGAAQTDLTLYSVTHGTPGDPYWGVFRKGVTDAGKLFGVEVVDEGPTKFSVAAVVDLLNSAIAARPDGLFVSITDPQAMDQPLRDAIADGIPVIATDVADPRPADKRIPYLFYIGGDELLGGQRAAQTFLSAGEATRALCAIQEAGNLSLEIRCQGFQDEMAKADVPVDELPIDGGDPTKAAETLRGYFTSHPETDVAMTLGPQGATPALQVFTEEDLFGKVRLGSFDLSQEQVNAIKEGQIEFTITTQQYLMGWAGIAFLTLHAQHAFTLAADLLTGPFFIDKSNVEQVERDVEEGYA